jgi:hypothetical protein
MRLEQIKPLPLAESPRRINPEDFDLNDIKTNILKTKELLRQTKKTPLKSFDDGKVTLWEFDGCYALIRHDDGKDTPPHIIYFVRYKVHYHNMIKRQCVQQVAVWHGRDSFSYGIAKDIFFHYLLESYQTIITDLTQTSDGERFWGNRILDAFTLGYYVYYINFLNPREITKVNDKIEYNDILSGKEPWGDHHKHQQRRFVITTKPF